MRKILLSCSLCFVLSAFLFSNNLTAQVMSNDDLKTLMATEWQRAKVYTQEYMNTMPADKYSFKAIDSLRSFAQQLLHLASANVFLMAQATGQPPASWVSFTLEKRTTAQGRDSVMYFVNASYDYAIDAIKNMDASKLWEHVKRGPYDETKFAWLQKAFEHQTHHRGQTTIYIRLQGIKPPQEKLF